ncbi:MAG: polysaccharide biosynthesis/export family protein [Thermaurantimonas sp.]
MKQIITLISIAVFFSSCVPRRKLTYFQDIHKASIEVDSAEFQKRLMIKYRLQVGDLVKVEVLSTNKEVNEIFNVSAMPQVPLGMMGGQGGGLDPLYYLNGYTIDINGKIKLPVLGEVYIAGKTLLDAQEIIEKELYKFFEPGTVSVKLSFPGINVKVIGDVRRPGRYVFFRNYVTIIDALVEAGDIDFVGDRTEVEIIRMTPNGYVFKTLDLTNRAVLASADIFLEPNDIINVKPLPAKSWGIGTTGFQTITGLLSVISSLLTLVIVYRSLR